MHKTIEQLQVYIHVAAGVYVTPLRMLEIAAQVVNWQPRFSIDIQVYFAQHVRMDTGVSMASSMQFVSHVRQRWWL